MDPRVQEEIDRQEKAEREAAERAKERLIRRQYVATFTSDSGRAVLADLRETFYDRTCFVPGDPYGTHVAEGARQVVLRILTVLAEEASNPPERQETAET